MLTLTYFHIKLNTKKKKWEKIVVRKKIPFRIAFLFHDGPVQELEYSFLLFTTETKKKKKE